MTAADALSVQPAARPEPSAAKSAAPESPATEHKAKSFADVLDAETTEKPQRTETPEKPADLAGADDVATEATIIAAPIQPAAPQATPAAASPAAILAGLDPNAVAAEGVLETPALDGMKPALGPEIAIDTPPPSPVNIKADPAAAAELIPAAPVAQDVAAQQVAVAIQPVVAPPARPVAKKDAKVETADPAIEAADIASPDHHCDGVRKTCHCRPGATCRCRRGPARARRCGSAGITDAFRPGRRARCCRDRGRPDHDYKTRCRKHQNIRRG